VSGDVLIAAVGFNNSGAAITPPSGWTLVRRMNNSATTANALAVYRRTAVAGEPASHAFAIAGGAFLVGGIQAFSGVDTANPIDVENGQSTVSGTNHDTPSVTTATANAMLVTAHTFASASTWTPQAGLTEGFDRPSGANSATGQSIAGNYQLQALAGASGTKRSTAAVNADVGNTHILALRRFVPNVPPTVSLTSPANGATFTAPANITLTATAADSDGTIQKVEFFHGGTNLIATLTVPPYTIQWTAVPQGAYALTAVATDNGTATTTSTPVNVTVGPAVAQVYFIEVDHLNTPRLVANSTGTTVWRWDQQEPFGVSVPDENPSGLGTFEFPMRFPGQYADKETNLSDNINRTYDASLGRYIQPDPIGIVTTTAPTATTSLASNLYLYALARPTSVFDPDGREVQTCCGMTSALPDALVMVGLECMSTCLNDTIYISSGTRTPGQNVNTSGAASQSQHLTGLAADVHIPPSKSKIRRAAAECGFFVLPRDYPRHVHVDLRNGINPKIEPNECVCQQIRSSP
jgi:RHS repeat-associated protein